MVIMSAGRIGVKPTPPHGAVISKRLHFSGMIEDLEAKRQADAVQARARIPYDSKLLASKFCTVNRQVFTHLDLLRLIREKQNPKDGSNPTLLTGALKPYVSNPVVRFFLDAMLETSMDELVSKGFLERNRRPGLGDFPKWYLLTERGLQSLEKNNDLGSGSVAASAAQSARQIESGQDSVGSSTAPKMNRLEKLKLLLMKNSAGISGWELLERLEAMDKDRNFLFRLMCPGTREASLLATIPVSQHGILQEHLEKLEKIGMLSREQGPSWVLTDLSTSFLNKKDPQKAFDIQEEELHQLIQTDIDRLVAEGKKRQEEFQAIEATCREAKSALEVFQSDWEAAKQEAILTYDKANALQNTSEKERFEKEQLMEEAEEKLFLAERAKQRMETGAQQLALLQKNVDMTRELNKRWKQQSHQTMLKLDRAQMQLKFNKTLRKTFDVFKELQMIESEQHQLLQALRIASSSVIASIEADFQSLMTLQPEQSTGVLQESRQLVQGQDLAEKIESLRNDESLSLLATVAPELLAKAAADSALHTQPK